MSRIRVEFILCTYVTFLSEAISHKYDLSKEKYYKKYFPENSMNPLLHVNMLVKNVLLVIKQEKYLNIEVSIQS